MWSEKHEQHAAEMRRRNELKQKTPSNGNGRLFVLEEIASSGATEYHFTPQEISSMWQLSAKTIIELFRDEPGVLKIGRRQARRGQRSYITLRVPESAVQRVHRRLGGR
jgi:hypothetical protein